MGLFKNVVVAYDHSDSSKKALQLALEIIQEDSSRNLTVAHVFEDNNDIPNTVGERLNPNITSGFQIEGIRVAPIVFQEKMFDRETHKQVTHSADRALFNVKQSLQEMQIDANFKMLEGKPADSIADFASRTNTDLLVIGESEKGIFQKVIGKSVMDKSLKNADCPVLIAK